MLPPVIAVIQADIAQFMEGMDSIKESLAGLAESAGPLDDLSATFASVGASGDKMATSLDASSKLAADSFKIILDAAVELGEGIQAPLDAVKVSIRGVASALRALAKVAPTVAEAATPAFGAISSSAEEMAASIKESVATVDASLTGLDAGFGTAAAAATAAATEMTTAGTEGAAAATAAGDASAASAEKSGMALDGTAGALSKYALGLAAAGFGVFEAIKGATQFQTAMTTLQTQAGLTNAELKASGMTSQQLNATVLNLGTQVGETGTEMAQALYHPISAGLDLKTALLAVTDAGKESKISGSDLEDTTYSLSSVMKAFNYSAAQTTPTMAALNAIVGSGDMRFQDLNASVKSWAPSAATLGVSLNSVGAALDYMTDRGDTAQTAGTKLSMMMALMVGQSKQAAGIMVTLGLDQTQVKASTQAMSEALEKSGVTQGKLAGDMKQPDGLYVALSDLRNHMIAAGVSGSEANSLLVKAFGGGKNFKAVSELIDNLGGLKSKFDQISQDGSVQTWQSDWQKASQTMGVEFDQMKAGIENLGIKIGTILIPPLEKFLGWVRTGIGWITQHKQAVQALAAILGGVLLAAVVAVVTALVTAIGAISGVTLIIAGIGAAAIYAYTHFKGFRDIVNDVAKFLKTVLIGALHLAQEAIKGLINWFDAHKFEFIKAWNDLAKGVHTVVQWIDTNVIQWIKARISDLTTWWSAHSQEISEVWSAVWSAIGTYVKIIWDGIIHPTLIILMATWTVVWGVIRDVLEMAWNMMKDVITTVMHVILNVIGIALDLLTGHWGKAWTDVKKLVSQGIQDVGHLFGQFASGAVHLLEDAGKNIIMGLIHGIEGAIGGISGVMGDVASEIKKFLPWSPAKKGPLSGSGAPQIGGRNVVRQIAEGMAGGTADISAAMQHVATTASAQLAVRIPAMAGVGTRGAPATAGAGGTQVVNNITVQGSVVSEKNLRDVVQKQMLQLGMRNSQTYQSYKR
jgi:TP901 family phage tail tape measure protein